MAEDASEKPSTARPHTDRARFVTVTTASSSWSPKHCACTRQCSTIRLTLARWSCSTKKVKSGWPKSNGNYASLSIRLWSTLKQQNPISETFSPRHRSGLTWPYQLKELDESGGLASCSIFQWAWTTYWRNALRLPRLWMRITSTWRLRRPATEHRFQGLWRRDFNGP